MPRRVLTLYAKRPKTDPCFVRVHGTREQARRNDHLFCVCYGQAWLKKTGKELKISKVYEIKVTM